MGQGTLQAEQDNNMIASTSTRRRQLETGNVNSGLMMSTKVRQVSHEFMNDVVLVYKPILPVEVNVIQNIEQIMS